MKKLFVVITMLLAVFSAATEEVTPFKVSLWVECDNEYYTTRIANEFENQLLKSEEFIFVIEKEDVFTSDFHVVLRGMNFEDGRYAWALGITPLFEPAFNDADILWCEDSISGMNWVSRYALQQLEELIYYLYDYYNELSTEEEGSPTT